ncbi:Lipopolysaccharide biosynthesis regulator YciM, contains six TPR domains and a predicted metal-binding C-terminal domain [Paucidesulfovibrio gracilis DSM 16080]|uniref:Lipopolysaccharide biosynthesis regulator YciM, contains six TPR domains and a predicted metal-binding C-terminal domain n=1 Tax=Paucidesulfovibrio gracilis DSM 16080 TaxID=1121449 RepID=A0A1T4WN14_9BACT|nr:tetratricopeptide repeat protein [Paucidesulfovibrio gracilis]SKA78750.1 Lipopolysaccharide biosynthesis regulator YciM, contains six TPR domains and a predicted metal-binding C-terminal domain [Paucidesulfovibrio gracilis DSM 16080]
MLRNLFRSRRRFDSNRLPDLSQPEGRFDFASDLDTKAAIDELSKVVRNNSEVVEIYLALGSLYRAQGEIERAIQIRNNITVRPGLAPEFRARAYYELGRDFRRGGFLDRAATALDQAEKLGGRNPHILLERARLAAQGNDYGLAAKLYGELNFSPAQAHYLVRQSQEERRAGNTSQAERSLRHALKAHPGSVEAWLERLIRLHDLNDAERFGKAMREALDHVPEAMRFAVLEGLMDHVRHWRDAALPASDEEGCDVEDARQVSHGGLDDEELKREILPVIDERQPDAMLSYYGALLLQAGGYAAVARAWFERALKLDPDFWLARLELFNLARADQQLTPFFEEQLVFFIEKARTVKRFVCKRCGLKRDTLFFVCPRCKSWHSITFRASIDT